jgi:hypothetical protein
LGRALEASYASGSTPTKAPKRRHSSRGSEPRAGTVTTCTCSAGTSPCQRASRADGSRFPQLQRSPSRSRPATKAGSDVACPSLSVSCQAAGTCSTNARAVATTCTCAGARASRKRSAEERGVRENHSLLRTAVSGQSRIWSTIRCITRCAGPAASMSSGPSRTALATRLRSNLRRPGMSTPLFASRLLLFHSSVCKKVEPALGGPTWRITRSATPGA